MKIENHSQLLFRARFDTFSTSLIMPLSPNGCMHVCMPGPNVAAFIELSSRGACNKVTSTHAKLSLILLAQHRLVNSTDLTSPFAAGRVIDHTPLGQ